MVEMFFFDARLGWAGRKGASEICRNAMHRTRGVVIQYFSDG